MNHRGEVIEKAVRESNIPISRIAKQLKKSRQFVYNIFETPNVPLDLILEIGKIINYDFSSDIKLLRSKTIKENKKNEEETLEYWKNKYIRLLENYNELLIEKSLTSKNEKTKILSRKN
jgi:hypothetical protein